MAITKSYVVRHLKHNYDNFKLLKGPLLVIAHFMLPAPISKTLKFRVLRNFLPHIKKPDGDNLEKFLNDSLKGVIWEDDARIAWLLRSKNYTCNKKGRTILFVRELQNCAPDFDLILNDIEENINFMDEGDKDEFAE